VILFGTLVSVFLAKNINIFLIFLLIGLLFFLYAYTAPKKYLVLDREKELITFPDWFFYKPHTLPFNKSRFLWVGRGSGSGALSMNLVVTPPKSPRAINLYTHMVGCCESWSFFVWYMDKNRPLPPEDAFDPYRQQDFERRKAEGFPPPLYKSTFPTPEATPQQQAEREKYWKDADYFGESFSRWY
jgi:hypothetical protein